MGNMIRYPAIGSNDNWGAVVNENFRIIDQELKKLHNNVNATQLLVGANVPYIDLNNERFFVEILIPNSNGISFNTGSNNVILNQGDVVLKYYPKKVKRITSNKVPNEIYVRQQGKWMDSVVPPLYCAAYVLNVLIINSAGQIQASNSDTVLDGVQYHRGEILVRTQSFGSLYGNDYISVTFNKYPSMGDYYIPEIAPESPYNLTFEKTDYVTWFISNNADDTNGDDIPDTYSYALPSIGLGNFNYFTIDRTGEASYTVSMNGNTLTTDSTKNAYYEIDDGFVNISFAMSAGNIDKIDDIAVSVNWTEVESDDNLENPIMIDHFWRRYFYNSKLNIFWRISCDVKRIQIGTPIKCVFWFTHKNNFA